MNLTPGSIPPRDFYRHMVSVITPRPIAWVSTISSDGRANLAPYSFFNGVGANPPAVMFSAANRRDGSEKDTLLNVRATREFVINIVPAALGLAMNNTSAEVPHGQSEFELAHLTPVPSQTVRAPGVAESPVRMECKLHSITTIGTGALAGNCVIGLIERMHVDDRVLKDGQIDPHLLDTIGRMGGSFYTHTRDLFSIERPT